MEKEDWVSKLFQTGLGDCLSARTLIAFARNQDIPKEDSEHIEICSICQTNLESIKENKVLMNEDLSFLEEESLDSRRHNFRRSLCHYVGEEYLKKQTQLKPELHKTRIDDILSRLESTYKPYKPEPSIDMQSLQFSPEELQPNTLNAYVIISFLITSLSIASEDFPLDPEKLSKKVSKSVALLEQQGLFDERDLHRTKAIIEGFLPTKGI